MVNIGFGSFVSTAFFVAVAAAIVVSLFFTGLNHLMGFFLNGFRLRRALDVPLPTYCLKGRRQREGERGNLGGQGKCCN